MQLSKEYFIYQLQITWSRLEDDVRPYSLLTIGDQNYIEDKRFLVATPLRGLTNVSIFYALDYGAFSHFLPKENADFSKF